MTETPPEQVVNKHWADEILSFDTETTGINVKESRIVSAALIRMNRAGEVLSREYWLVNPGVPIPDAASAVHGITDELVKQHGIPSAEALKLLLERISASLDAGVPLVIYNAPYDLQILYHEAIRHGLSPISEAAPVFDPLIVDKQLDRYRKGKRKLEITAKFYGVELDNAHNASSDALASAGVALALANKFVDELNLDAYQLHELQRVWAKEQAQSFQDWMRSNRDPNFTASGRWPM